VGGSGRRHATTPPAFGAAVKGRSEPERRVEETHVLLEKAVVLEPWPKTSQIVLVKNGTFERYVTPDGRVCCI
jgi:hypothetical protein